MFDLTIQDLTVTDQMTEVENARPDKDGPIVGSIWPPTLSLIRGWMWIQDQFFTMLNIRFWVLYTILS